MHILHSHTTAQTILWAYGTQKRQGVGLLCHRSAVVAVAGLSSTGEVVTWATGTVHKASANGCTTEISRNQALLLRSTPDTIS